MEDKLDKIIEILEDIKENKLEVQTENNKVIMTFSENDRKLKPIMMLDTILMSLEELRSYRREIYKYGTNKDIVFNAKEHKGYEINELFQNDPRESTEGYRTYMLQQDVIEKLDSILDPIYYLLQDYWF